MDFGGKVKKIRVLGHDFNVLTAEEISKLTDNRLKMYLSRAKAHRSHFGTDRCEYCGSRCEYTPKTVFTGEALELIRALDWAIAESTRVKIARS